MLKTAINFLSASDKGKNDATSAYLADPEVSENMCY